METLEPVLKSRHDTAFVEANTPAFGGLNSSARQAEEGNFELEIISFSDRDVEAMLDRQRQAHTHASKLSVKVLKIKR